MNSRGCGAYFNVVVLENIDKILNWNYARCNYTHSYEE